jgi:hypothetical protein
LEKELLQKEQAPNSRFSWATDVIIEDDPDGEENDEQLDGINEDIQLGDFQSRPTNENEKKFSESTTFKNFHQLLRQNFSG